MAREVPVLTVSADVEDVDVRLRAWRPDCPNCVAQWGRARPRWVRLSVASAAAELITPRRGRCEGCGRTHVLAPVSTLGRRADGVDVVGAALLDRRGTGLPPYRRSGESAGVHGARLADADVGQRRAGAGGLHAAALPGRRRRGIRTGGGCLGAVSGGHIGTVSPTSTWPPLLSPGQPWARAMASSKLPAFTTM